MISLKRILFQNNRDVMRDFGKLSLTADAALPSVTVGSVRAAKAS